MRRPSTALFLIFATLLLARVPSFAAGNNKALLIGISQYADPEMNDLAYADDEDVKTFRSILKDFADYRDADMNMLLNESATKKNIVDSIVALVKDSQKHPLDHFILMYAGHGLPSTIASSKTNSFLAPHDAYLNQFFPEGAGDLLGNETFINKAWLIRQLSAMNAKNIIIILDSCYSGARDFGDLYADNLGFKTELVSGGGGGGKRGITVVRKKGADAALDRRIAFLASSRENQPSAGVQQKAPPRRPQPTRCSSIWRTCATTRRSASRRTSRSTTCSRASRASSTPSRSRGRRSAASTSRSWSRSPTTTP